MSRTRNFQKKLEGRLRKEARAEEKKQEEIRQLEEEEAKTWLIGAKDNAKEIEKEKKKQEKAAAKALRKQLEEEELKRIQEGK